MQEDKRYKICQRCLKENPLEVSQCTCSSTKFAPGYVKKVKKINRQFSVQVTEIAEEHRVKDKPYQRITLYKWWPGNHSSMHINNQEEWETIKKIIYEDLGSFVNWKTKEKILAVVEKGKYKESAKDLLKDHPDFITEIINNIDFSTVDEKEISNMSESIGALVKALGSADESFVNAVKKLIEQLPKQGKRAIEDLSELLKQWTLRQITNISSEVKYRIDTIELFQKAILDDKTYEIRGDGSIHRILENAMWIVDERYWLLHSNETLRTIIGDEIVKTNKNMEDKRPDFVCGTIGTKLIIVELKRPSHELTIKDLEQLETYMMIIEQNSSEKYTFEGYLIGKKISSDLEKRLKYRGNQFKVRTFADLIDDVKKRYTEFYKQLKA